MTTTITIPPGAVPPTLTPTPRPIFTQWLSTATPTVTATAQVLVVMPGSEEPECDRPDSLPEIEVDVVGPGFCIVWLDEFDDERGFRVHLDYFQSGERFVYEIGPGIIQLLVPETDAPRLNESLQQCLRRMSYEVKVIVLRPAIEWPVGSMMVNTECGSLEGSSLPTATTEPHTSTPEALVALPGTIERVSVAADGRFVAFVSRASNLMSGDTNEHGDIFVRDLQGVWLID